MILVALLFIVKSIVLERMILMNRGSEFRKWDLHVHSPYTVLNNQFSKLQDGNPDIDCFIQKIKDENISAIG